jgi:hypothetical protein
VLDPAGAVIDVSGPALWELFGYKPADLVGTKGSILFADDDAWSDAQLLVFNPDRPATAIAVPLFFRHANGSLFGGEIVSHAQRDQAGTITGRIMLIRKT